MLIKIPRKEAIAKFPNLPLQFYNPKGKEYEIDYPAIFANHILTLPAKSFSGHIRVLGREIAGLITNLGYDKLIFLGDERTPWQYRDHLNKLAKEGLQYLADNKIGKRFNGAIEVDIIQLPIFIVHLCWLVSTNAVLPCVHFTDPGQNIIGNICQYGNLHISTLTSTADLQFKKVLATSKLEFLTGQTCTNKFSITGTIKGRDILL